MSLLLLKDSLGNSPRQIWMISGRLNFSRLLKKALATGIEI